MISERESGTNLSKKDRTMSWKGFSDYSSSTLIVDIVAVITVDRDWIIDRSDLPSPCNPQITHPSDHALIFSR